MDLLCLGGVNIDWVSTVPGQSFPQEDIPVEFKRCFGGCIHNVAQNLLSFGHQISMFSVLGQDENADKILEEMEQSGLNCQMIFRAPDFPTGAITLVNNHEGELIFHHADTEIYQEITPDVLAQNLDHFLSYKAWIADTDLNAKALGALAELKPKHIPFFALVATKEKTMRIKPALHNLDYLFINHHEAQLLTDIPVYSIVDSFSSAQVLLEMGVKQVFLTLGERGVSVVSKNTQQHFEALEMDALHTIGAGDAFASGVIDGVMQNKTLEQTVQQGLLAAKKIASCPKSSYANLYDIIQYS